MIDLIVWLARFALAFGTVVFVLGAVRIIQEAERWNR